MKFVASVRRSIQNALIAGKGRQCNICGKECRRFIKFGLLSRPDARCPNCGLLERHRLTWAFFQDRTDVFSNSGQRMLHIAPEPFFADEFRVKLGKQYVTADLFDPRADFQWDIMDIPVPDESFDIIYCSHVLEHVMDDRQAMREFYRVLKPTGWAVLNVPVTVDKTFEDPTIVDPKERERLFGQDDHVRRYGPDYVDRLHEAGFHVKRFSAADLFSPERCVELGISTAAAGDVFYCTKQA
jgi:SAM-dependent methyltransferase